jgi:hypothetical protein
MADCYSYKAAQLLCTTITEQQACPADARKIAFYVQIVEVYQILCYWQLLTISSEICLDTLLFLSYSP